MVHRQNSYSAAAVLLLIFSAVLTSSTTEAYAFASSPSSSKTRYYSVVPTNTGRKHRIHRTSHRADGSAVTLYLFPSSPAVTSAANLPPRKQSINSSRKSKSALPAMSQSVLAESDTLPSFSTAHGLLSPEVVMRIADSNDLEMNGALHRFLKTYKSRGPMACLSMLSDPDILPELTRAMRDVA
ncbi:hypothetical protein QTG54_002783 [Skeletonema marinoi]|uniref:Uncharacterized protein n=1 Tax=Skeletonema marinoi TaxID=267567 RepID=A0AAD8YJ73_9STRA|nr:hypothetical protein QTG54_002783 [Skeletonema marinoi]|mmetsp:Transcript_26372/g.44871  ORF Transcript_26372/g.44871 Transcript_26372/m.44871 type:complete len:184 (-) Transcript_26372:380-931(-)|eukprot:scaffold20692_cov147-Skeletonema_marinoi.AAC.4